jgi:hypothetical protein
MMADATIAQMRVLVNDPSGTDEIFDDDHYQTIIDIETNVYRAAATSAKTLAAYYAAKVNVTAGPVKIENTQKFEHYDALADSYDQRAREGGGTEAGVGAPAVTGVSHSEIDAANEDTDRYQGKFYRGMDDYPKGDIDTDERNL